MKVVMNLTDLTVVAFALGGGVMGLVMLGLWALADIGPPDSEDRYPHVFTQPRPKAALSAIGSRSSARPGAQLTKNVGAYSSARAESEHG